MTTQLPATIREPGHSATRLHLDNGDAKAGNDNNEVCLTLRLAHMICKRKRVQYHPVISLGVAGESFKDLSLARRRVCGDYRWIIRATALPSL